jgi:putative lipoprotein (rSAM/lipoprotein system)
LIVEDVDGDTNGAYQNDTIDINYNNAQKVKDGEGTWNNGTFTIKQDIKLKKK